MNRDDIRRCLRAALIAFCGLLSACGLSLLGWLTWLLLMHITHGGGS